MAFRDGVRASYVGISRRGRAEGDRCDVMSDDGDQCHVRWVTGSRVDETDIVRSDDLVFDDRRAAWGVTGSHDAVLVDVEGVWTKTGSVGLITALETEGVLESAYQIVREGVQRVCDVMEGDPAWIEVLAKLGEDSDVFLRDFLQAMAAAAIDEKDQDEDERQSDPTVIFE